MAKKDTSIYDAIKYSFILSIVIILSDKRPNAVLHLEHNSPRIFPVEWQWSTANDLR